MEIKKISLTLAIFVISTLVQAKVLQTTPLLESKNPTPQDVQHALQKTLEGQGDIIKRYVRRLGEKTIEMQSFLSIEGNLGQASKILPDFPRIPAWALANINTSPSGRNYYFKITGATPEGKDLITFDFTLDLPLYKHRGARKFRFQSETAGEGLLVSAEAVPEPESVISSTNARLYVFRAGASEPGRVWLAIIARMVIRPWLLYEALPERLIASESTERLETVIANYQAEEDKRSAKGKTVKAEESTN
jgi:hypothetical protein